ncbi:proline dehydrogenase family protein [Sodalis sp. RH21]|uniref:proline dehydrogenase family protein n=1 Tax=unclassified Sodalis (in: enterobacteria) TaxID=2636512 RepID=UPI0039B49D3B
MKINTGEIYSRYNTSTLIFKYITTNLLTHSITRTFSLRILKRYLACRPAWLLKLIHGIYLGGQSLAEVDLAASRLAQDGVCCAIDYAAEGENNTAHFNLALKNTFQLIDMAARAENLPFVIIKPSTFGNIELYTRMTQRQPLNAEQQIQWRKIVSRYRRIFDRASSRNVNIMVDAEQSWFQPAASRLVLAMMPFYNRHRPLITLTLQCYLRDQMDFLRYCYQQACNYGFHLGLKVVRGAYLEEERRHGGYQPCFAEKWQTDSCYHETIDYIVQRLDRITPFFATHNEESIDRIINHPLLRHHTVWIGQLYGFGDHITYKLLHARLRVCKYLPYGPIHLALPYLLRRIEENAIATPTFKTENRLVKQELSRRFFRRSK